MAQKLITLPIISKQSSSESPRDIDNQQYDVSQIFIQRLCPTDSSYEDFFRKYLLQNQPCIFSSKLTQDWLSRQNWVDGGDAVVPVANCGQEKFSSHCKEDMVFREFLEYWETYISDSHPKSHRCLYLKDWHFTKAFPDYHAYSTPVFFSSDWMNEFWDSRADSDDDYRFVYMGPKGTWTPFHADVFRSYSWSANICGRKRWIFIAPGEEDKYRNKFGNLVYDINSDELNDLDNYPHYSRSAHRIEVIQEPGEVIFVPSGWHHQVHNLEDTISINHNWMNGCNLNRCWSFLKQELSEVQREISDCRDMDGWNEQCQLILKASSGIDFSEFYRYLVTIATNRMNFLCMQQTQNSLSVLKISTDESSVNCQSSDHTSHCEGDTCQSGQTDSCDRTVNMCQNKIQLDSYKNVQVDPRNSLSELDMCQNDNAQPTCDNNEICDRNKRETESQTGSVYHALFDLIQVKQTLVDMIKTEEFQGIATNPDVRSVIDMMDDYIGSDGQ
ncbi:2-oxoglutarate and iron-dependent oxygenase JMJD4-like isoform X2 [Argopecten irradians]|uniref:2-oxoglutarate and iron-dependent oxygenase JMJD4-like isoform X2 n=1 Tax=Argopecten irradians TaxID=31199 RepID=UPI00371505CC